MLMTLSRGARQCALGAVAPVLTAAAIAAAAPAQAGTTIYSTGFEAPDYAAGQLSGQNGWTGAANAAVQTSTVESGAQAVTVDPGATGQHITFVGVSYNSVGNTEHLVTISTDFLLSGYGAVAWEALVATGNGGFITQMTVNGQTGQVCNFNPCSGPILALGTWYKLSMELDYLTGTVRNFVDGVEFSSGPFSNVPAASTTLGAIGFGTNNNFAAGNSARASWDNLSVTSAGVPEPATWAMMVLGFGMLGLARRRRTATLA